MDGTWDSDPSVGSGGFYSFSGGTPTPGVSTLGPVSVQNNANLGHMVTAIVVVAVLLLVAMVIGLRVSGEVVIT